ncbi:hypothetical protein DEI92_00845 [Curtobacterium sp. MCBD17_034]|uniref:hypothetical protein n=1 Tax=unclassified Curtobacterium TaxID=257496 RepID=UPI000DA8C80B|nr:MULTISPECIES: hypothetical protein [unclassified Curtobacterium]PZF62098.1 hypothetical protein DEI92_00845 [Curtobacterium sp. MCBD17_034]PZM33968.1 hypothetical protein DEI90_09850 [Curtobacterium sp. MCBD17_031]
MHDVVTRVEPLVTYDARQLYPAVTRLVHFAHDEHAPLEDDVVFDPFMIGRFVNHHLAGYNRASRNTIRARLRRVSEALLGEAAAGRFKALGKTDAVRPYSAQEQAALEAWSRAQTSPERRTSAGALLSLGFGAGLTGAEIVRQRLEDVHVGATSVVVRADGREVPVSAEWAAPLVARAAFLGGAGWAFRADQRGENINLVTDFVSRTAAPTEIHTRRMRATWLVSHLDAGTPLKTGVAVTPPPAEPKKHPAHPDALARPELGLRADGVLRRAQKRETSSS